jgi:NADPH-dependent curcumin reductase
MKNTQILLKLRPQGMVQDENFEIKQTDLSDLQEGQLLIANKFISIAPAIRGWMNARRTYIDAIEIGAVIRAFAVGEVIDSKNPHFKVGDAVEGLLGAQQFVISNGKELQKLDFFT